MQLVPQKDNPFGVPAIVERRAPVHTEETFSFRHYLEILRRRWRWIAVVLTLVVAATAIQVATITPLYRASATIQVDPDVANLMPFQDIGQSRRGRDQEDYLNTQLTKLKSPVLAERVVNAQNLAKVKGFSLPIKEGLLKDGAGSALGVVKKLIRGAPIRNASNGPSQRTLVNRVREYTTAAPIRRTRLLQLHFDSPDRDAAQLVANGLARLFVDQHLEANFKNISQATKYLQKQLEDLKIEFEDSEAQVRKFAKTHDIVDLGERQSSSLQKMSDLSKTITVADDEIAAQASRYDSIRNATVESLPDSLMDSAFLNLLHQRREFENQLAELRSQFGPAWPAVRDTEDKLADLDVQLIAEKSRAAERAQRELELLRARRGRLRGELASVQRAAGATQSETIEYDLMKKEAATNKELYEGVLTRLKQAGVAAGLQIQNVSIAQPALRPISPFTPNKTQALMLALLLGTSLGVVAAFLVELVDNTLKDAEDVTRYLNLPSLGTIPRLKKPARRRWWKKTQTEEVRVLLSDAGPSRQASRAREAYRALRTAILLSHSGKPPQTILITSAAPSEGKSTTAANVAIALAEAGNRTLLVDMDLRKPKLSKLLELNDEIGLSGFLAGNSDLSSRIQETTTANLFFIGAGHPPPNPPELLGSERMERGFKLMREYFTHVVIDSPPSLELSDPLVISQNADGVILIARSGRTPRAYVGRTAQLLQSVGAKILGVVVNDVESSRFRYGYYSKYGYYDSYYPSQTANS